MEVVSKRAHVTLSGDFNGEYIVKNERPDGTLVVVPDTSVAAVLARHGARPMNAEEFERHFGDLPTDDEG
jgi:hypothetical protein